MRTNETDSEFEAFVSVRQGRLLNAAYALCGDWHTAHDLTQNVLVKLYVAWPRVSKADSPDAYASKCLMNVFIDHGRRPWRRDVPRELPMMATTDRTIETLVERDAVVGALNAISPRMRAAVVCRHLLDLDVESTAEVLGCSTGTVKSQTARGLAALRRVLDPQGEFV